MKANIFEISSDLYSVEKPELMLFGSSSSSISDFRIENSSIMASQWNNPNNSNTFRQACSSIFEARSIATVSWPVVDLVNWFK